MKTRHIVGGAALATTAALAPFIADAHDSRAVCDGPDVLVTAGLYPPGSSYDIAGGAQAVPFSGGFTLRLSGAVHQVVVIHSGDQFGDVTKAAGPCPGNTTTTVVPTTTQPEATTSLPPTSSTTTPTSTVAPSTSSVESTTSTPPTSSPATSGPPPSTPSVPPSTPSSEQPAEMCASSLNSAGATSTGCGESSSTSSPEPTSAAPNTSGKPPATSSLPSTLPQTGSNVAVTAMAAVGALALGAALISIARRKGTS